MHSTEILRDGFGETTGTYLEQGIDPGSTDAQQRSVIMGLTR